MWVYRQGHTDRSSWRVGFLVTWEGVIRAQVEVIKR